jgi:hypothetical protein
MVRNGPPTPEVHVCICPKAASIFKSIHPNHTTCQKVATKLAKFSILGVKSNIQKELLLKVQDQCFGAEIIKAGGEKEKQG